MKKILILSVFLFCKVGMASELKEDEFNGSFLLENTTDSDIKIYLFYFDLRKVVGKNVFFTISANSVKQIPVFDVTPFRVYKINLLWFNIDKDLTNVYVYWNQMYIYSYQENFSKTMLIEFEVFNL